MTTAYFNEFKKELEDAFLVKNHPFRCFTLATVGLDKIARLRTIVLRELNSDLELIFYTDKRSKKVTHIKENNNVSLLFYHPEKFIQLKVEGIATVDYNPITTKKTWDSLHSEAKKDYTTTDAPGSKTSNPNNVEFLNTENNFCMVTITPIKIEYLKIQKPHHLKVRFSKNNENWTGEFLVP